MFFTNNIWLATQRSGRNSLHFPSTKALISKNYTLNWLIIHFLTSQITATDDDELMDPLILSRVFLYKFPL